MSVTQARGFEASGVHSGVKQRRLDLAIVRSALPAVGAGMFTLNRMAAAPVVVSRRHLELAQPQAVVINSGCANAATGERGMLDAQAMGAETARCLGLHSEQVLVLSTGLIGMRLPLGKVTAGIRAGAKRLRRGALAAGAAAEAIRTTDTHAKQAAVTDTRGFTVGGMAKGSAMIHPMLATMLAVITTDYPLATGEADAFLRPAVEHSFNRISVEGDCSTNDAVVLLANGDSGVQRSADSDAAFARALEQVCRDLSGQIVRDAEGISMLIEIAVRGAACDEDALAIAQRIATSPLVKTAVFGRDPNWGRVLAAAGSASTPGGSLARLNPDLLTLHIDGAPVFARGAPTGLSSAMTGTVCAIDLDLGLGEGGASYLASDLTHEYVRRNAEYST